MHFIRKRLYFLVLATVALLLHNAVHESIHYLAALLLGEGVKEFRFLTNAWLTSQVIYAAPVAERSGAHWLVIAWAPAVITTLIGYVIYLNRERWLTRWPPLNTGLWYAGLFFLCLDPFYFAVLSIFFGGDVNAVAAVGWSPWPVRLVALMLLVFNARLMLNWRREAQAAPKRYFPA